MFLEKVGKKGDLISKIVVFYGITISITFEINLTKKRLITFTLTIKIYFQAKTIILGQFGHIVSRGKKKCFWRQKYESPFVLFGQ